MLPIWLLLFSDNADATASSSSISPFPGIEFSLADDAFHFSLADDPFDFVIPEE